MPVRSPTFKVATSLKDILLAGQVDGRRVEIGRAIATRQPTLNGVITTAGRSTSSIA